MEPPPSFAKLETPSAPVFEVRESPSVALPMKSLPAVSAAMPALMPMTALWDWSLEVMLSTL